MSNRYYNSNSPFADVFIEVGQGRLLSDLIFSGVNFLVDAYNKFGQKREEARLRRDTVKAVSELSPELQRDIGWPERFENQMARRRR
ncbi:hypothetical protein AAFN47_08445 [Hoeflea sp. CAU 1731]